ncbi:MAG: hypothetical protein RIT43_1224 [Bacteroidota bacterium]|jgi:uncharacterized membrane protein YedE/YeeE
MKEPLAWYIAGPLLGLMVPLLLVLREKNFGISSSYRYIVSFIPSKINYFQYERESDQWQLIFSFGLILSGIAAIQLFGISDSLIELPLKKYELQYTKLFEIKNGVQFFLGGILVGFGARYANGCTAGHCIMGVSQFAFSSILATVCFFIGGLLGSYFIVPQIF